jgi:hypothetical protein
MTPGGARSACPKRGKAVRVLGLWKETFYVGTFGEYGLKYVR